MAECLADAHEPLGALAANADAAKLREAGLGNDVEWCAQESVLGCVPRVVAGEDGVAVVELAGSTERTHPVRSSGDTPV